MSQNKQIKKTEENLADQIDFDYEKLEDLPDYNSNGSKNPEGEQKDEQQTNPSKDQEKKEESKEPPAGPEEERNNRSVFVKNVHFAANKEEIEKHFADCGPINTITILKNKVTHQPQG